MQIAQTLPQDRLLAIDMPKGGKLRVSEGCVWFTVDGEDVVLTAGQRFQAQQAESWLLQALSDSRVEIALPQEAPKHWWSTWIDRLPSLG
ncbi:DUF2917 domain-containing protein [Chitinimonas lacunae]|uniref:DUF2917 domain-containing protein n=1 Tax=Chitinimonas lacunae TaxID=1963018 RepID=A0ABV8MMG1_9NEIS